MRPALAVGAIIFRRAEQEDEVCLIRRARPPNKGCWSLPGGRLEWGESLHDALLREVLEETHLRITVQELVDLVEIVSEEHHYVVADYLCALVDPAQYALAAGDDAAEAAWVPLSLLASKGVSAEVTAVVAKARQVRLQGRAGQTSTPSS